MKAAYYFSRVFVKVKKTGVDYNFFEPLQRGIISALTTPRTAGEACTTWKYNGSKMMDFGNDLSRFRTDHKISFVIFNFF